MNIMDKIIVDTMIKTVRNSKDDFVPLLSYENIDDANGVAELLSEELDQPDFILSVVEENNQYFVVASIDKKYLKCGGTRDEYCASCKVFHFDVEGLNSAQIIEKKRRIYERFRDKGKPETE